MQTATTAVEASERYQEFLARGALIQSSWHSRDADGRELACALSVIGPNINNPADCPAQIMPRWLAQMVPWFFDSQKREDALAWGARFYTELARLNGVVPFRVLHDWNATVVADSAIKAAAKRGRPIAPHEAKRDMHVAAMAGATYTVDQWRPVLRSAYAYASAYASADAHVAADADAYADASAYASADAFADAFADADAYASAYASAAAYAFAYADADAFAYADAIKRLADGMVDCLVRVPTASTRTTDGGVDA